MGEKSEDEKVRRILDVDVKEVSLVDRAANLRRFLVIKRLEKDESMGAFETDDERRNTMTKEELEKAKKMKEEEEEEEKKRKAEEEEEEEKKRKAMEEEEEEKKKAMNPAAVAGIIRGLKGAPKEAVDKLVAWLETKKQDSKEKYPYPAPAKKDMEGVSVAVMEDGSVIVSGQEVSKSKKFTSSRTDTLKQVAMQLMKLIGDVDQDTMKAIVDSLKELPEGKSPPSAVRPVGTQKSLEEEEVLKQLRDENEGLKGRVEALEKAKMPSKSVEGNGGTDSQTVKKGLWSGVL